MDAEEAAEKEVVPYGMVPDDMAQFDHHGERGTRHCHLLMPGYKSEPEPCEGSEPGHPCD